MSKFLKAAEDVKALNRMFESVKSMAEAMEEIGSIDNAKGELEAKKIIAQKELDALLAKQFEMFDELKALETKIDETKANGVALAEQARLDADHLRSVAKAEADQIINNAREQESIIIVNIKAKQAELEEVQKQVNLESQALESLKKKIEETKKSLKDLIS